MILIYETENFKIEVPDRPHIDRKDGGHIIISPKVNVEDRTKLSTVLSSELMMLTMITGEAMKIVLNKHGVDIARINYQENGNWKPVLHEHIYGRAKSAKIQKFGDALYFPKPETGFYESFKPLNNEDIKAIKLEIEQLLKTKKYK